MNRVIDVLLVEDNPADADLASELIVDWNHHVRIRLAADGADALAYVMGRTPYARAAPVDLIVLDLNIPKLDGASFLGEVKRSPDLRHIPVVVLTSSDASRDVRACYTLGANCYVLKPVGLAEYQAAVRAIAGFWLDRARLP